MIWDGGGGGEKRGYEVVELARLSLLEGKSRAGKCPAGK